MNNKLTRKGRKLNEEQQIQRLEMIREDIKYLQDIFETVLVENEITHE